MNLTSVKKASEITLAGVTAEIDSNDNIQQAITLRDADGGLLRITAHYGINILVPAPPKTVKKYRLAGKFAGLVDVTEDFDEEYEAKDRLREYERKHNGDDTEVGLTVSVVDVQEAAA